MTLGESSPASMRREQARLACYLASLALLSGAATWALLATVGYADTSSHARWLVASLMVLVLSEPAQHLVHQLLDLVLKDPPRPRLAFADRIPREYCTAVVIPALLSDPVTIVRLLKTLEEHFLGNRDAGLRYVLLTDHVDARSEHMPNDLDLLHRAMSGIAELNRRYQGPEGELFFLMHRPRLWAPAQGIWMGRERKRGKLMDFNALVLRGDMAAFTTTVGNPDRLKPVRFVITLDADTVLPAGAARAMVGAIAHPANQPVHDMDTRVVIAGHGVMQPRMIPRIDPASATRWQCLTVDPGTSESSSAPSYGSEQKLFGTSAFFGKGIYDIAAFDLAIAGRLPNDWILSHDLLEGAFLRCGELPDVTLTETVPSNLLSEFSRKDRWIRGDWQSLPWTTLRAPNQAGEWVRNPLSHLSRWRVADNLRRTLWPVAAVALSLMGSVGWVAQGVAISTVCVAVLLPITLNETKRAMQKPAGIKFSQHLRSCAVLAARNLWRSVVFVSMIPATSVCFAKAMASGLWRTFVSRRDTLAWIASDATDRRSQATLTANLKALLAGPVAALALIAPAISAGTATWTLSLLWAASPLLAWKLGQPMRFGGDTAPASRTGGRRRFGG